jgi:hypothetical protein
MSKVSFSEGGSVGGILELYLQHFWHFSSLNPVTFKNGADWDEMEFLPESASCKDSASRVDNGTEYSYSLVFGFNKQSENLYNAFARYIGQTGIVKFTDHNGLTRILGTLKNRVTVKQDGDTGNNPTDMNSLKLTVTWLSYRPAQLV